MEWEKLLSSNRIGGKIEPSYKDLKYSRSEFEKDYRRIVSCASFRRLQDKTQVFPLDKSDFVRTRLTHSIETASFAKELGDMAVKRVKQEYEFEENTPDNIDYIPDILMCAGLLHDIGNPPFGHFGEVVIGNWFKENLSQYKFRGDPLSKVLNVQMQNDLCSFEGNAQALRLLSRLHFTDNDNGLNLTDAVLNTLVKYPNISTNINPEHEDIKYHKMGYFYADTEVFKTIASRTGTYHDEKEFYRHPLTFLLEAADDIAYSTADLEDGFKKGLFSLDELYEFLLKTLNNFPETDPTFVSYKKTKTKELFDNLKSLQKNNPIGTEIKKSIQDRDLYAIQNWVIYVQEWLTYCAYFGFQKNYNAIMEGTYKHDLMFGTNHQYSLIILKKAMEKFIFPTKSILKLELAAKTILSSLLEKFIPAVLYYDCPDPEDTKLDNNQYSQSKADKKLLKLLSDNYIENYKMEAENTKDEAERLYLRLMLITDFISGMTDSYAKTLYQELNGIY